MSVITCPRCDEPVRVPQAIAEGHLSSDTLVRCAWCSESFPVAEAIDRLPPMLEIVSQGEGVEAFAVVADGQESLAVAGETIGEFPELTGASESVGELQDFALADPNLTSGGESQVGNEGSVDSFAASMPRASRGRNSARKKQGSPVATVIKIALGGLLAFPIAGTILALVGRPLPIDLGFFPFEGDFSRHRPNRVVAKAPDPEPESAVSSGSTSRNPPPSRVISPAESDETTRRSALDEFVVDENVSPTPMESKPSAEDSALADIQGNAEVQGMDLEMPEASGGLIPNDSRRPKKPFALPEEVAKPEPSPMETVDAEPAAEESTPALSTELADAIAEATTAVEKAVDLYEVDAIDKRVFQAAYRKVSEVASMLDDESASHESISSLVQSIGASRKLSALYSEVGPRWPRVPSRKTDGILLIGESQESNGKKRIDFGNDQTLTVKFDSTMPEGRIIALGRILEENQGIQLMAVESLNQ